MWSRNVSVVQIKDTHRFLEIHNIYIRSQRTKSKKETFERKKNAYFCQLRTEKQIIHVSNIHVALNNLQGLICRKTQFTQTTQSTGVVEYIDGISKEE